MALCLGLDNTLSDLTWAIRSSIQYTLHTQPSPTLHMTKTCNPAVAPVLPSYKLSWSKKNKQVRRKFCTPLICMSGLQTKILTRAQTCCCLRLASGPLLDQLITLLRSHGRRQHPQAGTALGRAWKYQKRGYWCTCACVIQPLYGKLLDVAEFKQQSTRHATLS